MKSTQHPSGSLGFLEPSYHGTQLLVFHKPLCSGIITVLQRSSRARGEESTPPAPSSQLIAAPTGHHVREPYCTWTLQPPSGPHGTEAFCSLWSLPKLKIRKPNKWLLFNALKFGGVLLASNDYWNHTPHAPLFCGLALWLFSML